MGEKGEERETERKWDTGCHSVLRCELISRYSYSFSHFSRLFVYNVLPPQSIWFFFCMVVYVLVVYVCMDSGKWLVGLLCATMIEIVSEFNSLSFFPMSHPPLPSSFMHVFVYDFCPWRFSLCRSTHISLFLSVFLSFVAYTIYAKLCCSSILCAFVCVFIYEMSLHAKVVNMLRVRC